MFKCHTCNKELVANGIGHIHHCPNKNTVLTKNEIKIDFLKYNFPNIAERDKLYTEYIINKKSLPTLKKEYNICYRAVQFLLKQYNITWRNSSQANNIAMPKRIQTNIEKYGAVNVLSKDTEIYKKRNKTVLDKYGVSNIFAAEEIKKRITSDELYLDKYGKTLHEFNTDRCKKMWAKKTDDQKNEWLKKSIWSKMADNIGISKLELRIQNILYDKNITFTSQFPLGHKYYDFCLPDIRLLIEVNGDYWHANPRKYKETDHISYFKEKKTAKSVWLKDEKKRQIALNNNYKIMYIWEDEIVNKDDTELTKLLVEKIDESCRN